MLQLHVLNLTHLCKLVAKKALRRIQQRLR
jgi:hypothetical protein